MTVALTSPAIDITKFRALFWDLPSSRMADAALRLWKCKTCGQVLPHEGYNFTIPTRCGCGETVDAFLVSAFVEQAEGGEHFTYCKSCKGKFPTLRFVDQQSGGDLMLACPAGHDKFPTLRDGHDSGWTLSDLAKLYALRPFIGNWRSRWFDGALRGWVYFDQFSVRIVPVEHSRQVQRVLEQARDEFCRGVQRLDVVGVLKEYHQPDDPIWQRAIRFPEFVAEDQDAKRMVWETVANSISATLREMKDGILEALAERGGLGDRAAATVTKRIAELKERDVWGVAKADPESRDLLEAIEGLLTGRAE